LMRSERVVNVLRRSLKRSKRRAPERFRVVEFSIQSDHLHLLVEAADKVALSRGMQGLAISMARRVNRMLGRRGRFWTDRFHARALKSPRAVRNGLVYVLANFRKHSRRHFPAGIDRFSSAAVFDGWLVSSRERDAIARVAARAHAADAWWPARPRGDIGARRAAAPVAAIPAFDPRHDRDCVARARTWLLRVGWRRHGLITLSARPALPG